MESSKICSFCGATIAEDAKFCSACGKQVEESEADERRGRAILPVPLPTTRIVPPAGSQPGSAGNAGNANAGDAGNAANTNAGDAGNAGNANAGDAGNAGNANAGDAANAGNTNTGDAGNAGNANAGDAGNAGNAGNPGSSNPGNAGNAGNPNAGNAGNAGGGGHPGGPPPGGGTGPPTPPWTHPGCIVVLFILGMVIVVAALVLVLGASAGGPGTPTATPAAATPTPTLIPPSQTPTGVPAATATPTLTPVPTSTPVPGAPPAPPPPPPAQPLPTATSTPPPQVQYSMTLTVDRTQYNPGQTINYCYRLIPQNVPYVARLYNTGTFLQEWPDNGNGGGDCINIPVNAQAQPGPRQLLIEAYVSGVKVAQATANFTIVALADRDGDGVPDNEDECPDTGGNVDQYGCPVEALLGGAGNLDGYCESKYGEASQAVAPGGVWSCSTPIGEISSVQPIDKNDACRWHYPGKNAYAKNVPNGFLCYSQG